MATKNRRHEALHRRKRKIRVRKRGKLKQIFFSCPEGGEQGGHLVAVGTPLQVSKDGKRSYTARFLREYLNRGSESVETVSPPVLEQVIA
jgi:hypothetical protein